MLTGNPEETAARATASEKDGDIKRVSTKEWARSTGYDPVKLFNKVPVRQIKLTGRFALWQNAITDFVICVMQFFYTVCVCVGDTHGKQS